MPKRVKPTTLEEELVHADESPSPSVAVIPVKEPEPVPMAGPSAPRGPDFRERARGFLNFLARLLLTLLVLGLIGVGVYMALPVLYQRYVEPVQQNTADLQALRDQQLAGERALSDLQTRLSEIETEQTRQADAFTDLDQRLGAVETEVTARSEALSALETMQATLISENEATQAELNRQIDLLKVMELLSRARLYMYQSNFGLARQDVQSARSLLANVQPDEHTAPSDRLQGVLLRLDLTLANLPAFPVAASDDLDIAWQLLLGSAPPVQAAPPLTLTATPLATVTSSPTQPAAQETLGPTPTP